MAEHTDVHDRLDRLERKVSELDGNGTTRHRATRRGALAGLAGAGLLGAASQPAAADPSPWEDSDGNGLLETPNHDGIEVDRARLADLGVERDARAYMLQNGYSNIAPATNALITEVLNEQIGGGKIVIPHPRDGDPGTVGNDWELSEPITVPYHEAREVTMAIVGAGTRP